jgi:hypothetical protein
MASRIQAKVRRFETAMEDPFPETLGNKESRTGGDPSAVARRIEPG